MNIPDLPRPLDYLYHWAAVQPEAPLLIQDDRIVSYAEVADRVDALAASLLAAAVEPEQRVAVHGLPTAAFMEALLAILSVGATYLGLNPKYKLAEQAYVLADAHPVLILDVLGDGEKAQVLAGAMAEARWPAPIVNLADDAAAQEFLARGATVTRQRVRATRDAVDPDGTAVLVYTSGSTGRPKGALLPHRGFAFCCQVQTDRLGYRPAQDRMICNLPINHVGAIGDICLSTLVGGGALVFQPVFDPVGVLDLIARHRVTLWGAVPAMFMLSVNDPGFPAADLSSVLVIMWSGGVAPVELVRLFRGIAPRLANLYGLTESVGSVTYADETDDDDTLANTIGRPDPRYQVQVARTDGTEADVDEPGEILIRGPHIMLGYLNRPQDTAGAIDADGWLHTGDIAVRRDDDALALVGRAKEMFKSGGYNVYPREIELVLEEHPDVTVAAVIDQPDPIYGQVGHAYVIPTAPNLTPAELNEWCRDRLANYKVPKDIRLRSELPLLPIGKVDKQALRTTDESR